MWEIIVRLNQYTYAIEPRASPTSSKFTNNQVHWYFLQYMYTPVVGFKYFRNRFYLKY